MPATTISRISFATSVPSPARRLVIPALAVLLGRRPLNERGPAIHIAGPFRAWAPGNRAELVEVVAQIPDEVAPLLLTPCRTGAACVRGEKSWGLRR